MASSTPPTEEPTSVQPTTGQSTNVQPATVQPLATILGDVMRMIRWNSGTVYIPPWTDPIWQDDGPNREKLHWPVHDRLMDVIRPAILPGDEASKPTEHARRFGIFPGRTDGRSCTSPTRSVTRLLPQPDIDSNLGDSNITGKKLFDDLEARALLEDKDLDEFMIEAKHDPAKLSGYSFSLRLYEELMLEEFWQGTLFGDMTMDELISGSHFDLSQCSSDLDGPLYRFLQRDRWHPKPYANDQKGPTNVWSLDGRSGDFNVATNDELWNALQPCLQLASRLIQIDDPFFAALQNIYNWYPVDPALDVRADTTKPLYRFELRANKSDSLGATAGVTPTDSFDPLSCTTRVLEKLSYCRVASCHANYEEPYYETTLGGWSVSNRFVGTSNELLISLSTEAVWQILSDKTSPAEKLMVSFVMAVTLVHEFMHQWRRATVEWIVNPTAFGISDERDVRFCNALKAKLFPHGISDVDEPLYKNDSISEVGVAFETHVLGNSVFGAFCGVGMTCPPLLRSYAGMANSTENTNGRALIPRKSRLQADWTTFERHYSVQRMFQKFYWDVLAAKYGSCLLRYRSDTPSRAFLAPEYHVPVPTFTQLSFGTRADREWLTNHILELRNQGQQILAHYCIMLLYDACRFEFMLRRFSRIADLWVHKNKVVINRLQSLLMIMLEAKVYCISKRPRSPGGQAQKRAEANVEFKLWRELEASAAKTYLGHETRNRPKSFDLFYYDIMHGGDVYERRITAELYELTRLLDSEQQLSESMLCELYSLPTALWRHYLEGFPGHAQVWTARCHRYVYFLRRIATELAQVESLNTPEQRERQAGWQARIKAWVEGFETIIDLMPGNADEVADNWRTLLVTVPMLRKARRKPWERLFYLAKKATLNLTGTGVAKMERFQQKLEDLLQVQSFATVVPGEDLSKQGLAEHWAGLLDDLLDFEKEQRILMAELGKQIAAATTRRARNEVVEEAERARTAEETRAASLAESYSELASYKFRKQHLASESVKEEMEANKRLRRERKQRARARAQVTRPLMQNHPEPLTGILTPGGSGQQQGAVPVINTARGLAEVANMAIDNHFAPAGGVHRPVPRESRIDGGVIEELAKAVQGPNSGDNGGDGKGSREASEALSQADEDAEKHNEAHEKALEGAAGQQSAAQVNVEREKALAREQADDVEMVDVGETRGGVAMDEGESRERGARDARMDLTFLCSK